MNVFDLGIFTARPLPQVPPNWYINISFKFSSSVHFYFKLKLCVRTMSQEAALISRVKMNCYSLHCSNSNFCSQKNKLQAN